MITDTQEVIAMGQLLSQDQEDEALKERLRIEEFQGRGEQLIEEKERVAEPNNQLRTKGEESRAMKEELIGLQGQEELLSESQQRPNELQKQLRPNEHELTTLREQLTGSRREVERLRVEELKVTEQLREEKERVAELNGQLRTKGEELRAKKKNSSDFKDKKKVQENRINELPNCKIG